MIRGTTPTHTFQLPFDTSEVRSVRVIYKQDHLHGRVVLTKEVNDCQMSGYAIMVTLTQEDTLKFICPSAQVQLRVLTNEGAAMACRPIKIDVCDCLDGEVLT